MVTGGRQGGYLGILTGRVCTYPCITPVSTGIFTFIGIASAITFRKEFISTGIVTPDIGKIIQDFVIYPGILPDLGISCCQVPGGTCCIRMTGHINEPYARVLRFEGVELIEIDTDI